MSSNSQLSIEQQFKVRLFETQVQNFSKDELQEIVVDLYENSLVQQRYCEKLMKECWGINHPAAA